MRTAIYPGSFDPITNGHLDVLHRATKLFDRVIVAVAKNDSKHPLFTLEERVQMVAHAIRHLPNVEADSFEGLLVAYVEKCSAQAVVRGLRAVSDFEFEFQLALMNRKLNERIETIFMMPKDTYTFLSSRIVKEIAQLGGDVSAFVPAHVRTALVREVHPKAGLVGGLMPLSVNLRHLEAHNIRLAGSLPIAELDLDPRDEVIQVCHPLEHDLEIQKLEDGLLVQGHLSLALECECVRCLKHFQYHLQINRWTCHLPLQGEDAVTVVSDCVDLTPYVREDILLEFPRHPLCNPECRGLPGMSAGTSGSSSDVGKTEMGSPAWAELNKLKF